ARLSSAEAKTRSREASAASRLLSFTSPLPELSLEERAVLVELELGFGIPGIHALELLGHALGDHQVAVPLVVGRHDVPRRPLRVAQRERVVVRGAVGAPLGTRIEIGLGELPVALGIAQALGDARALLFFADVEIELEDARPAVDEHALELVDL